MLLTFIGAIQVLFGLGLFLAGSIEAMFAFLLVSALFGGSAAIVLPALGGSSIPPVQFALVFMALRLLVPGAGHGAAVGQAARANIWLATFILYGAALAFIGPRLFAGQIDVTPMRGKVEARYISMRAYIYSTRPLSFSTQNITTTVYLVGTLLTAMAAHVVCSKERGRRVFVRTMAIAGLVHGLIGFLSVVAKGTPVDTVLALFRKTVPTGLQHGTVTVVEPEGHVEVTTFRGEEGYGDARRPDRVFFLDAVDGDLARRDGAYLTLFVQQQRATGIDAVEHAMAGFVRQSGADRPAQSLCPRQPGGAYGVKPSPHPGIIPMGEAGGEDGERLLG